MKVFILLLVFLLLFAHADPAMCAMAMGAERCAPASPLQNSDTNVPASAPLAFGASCADACASDIPLSVSLSGQSLFDIILLFSPASSHSFPRRVDSPPRA